MKLLKSKIKKIIGFLLILCFIILIPKFYAYKLNNEVNQNFTSIPQFPVTVDIKNKKIIEDPVINSYLQSPNSPLQANATVLSNIFDRGFSLLAIYISKITNSGNLALVGGPTFVTVSPGMRKEEVVNLFAKVLLWNEEDKEIFFKPLTIENLPFKEGSFYPSTYAINPAMTPLDVQTIINNRFTGNILSRYGTSTEEKVPLNIALTIASLIQKETIGKDDMRLVSGIIWNRLFANMNLQLDATLQYAKANTKKTSEWWPSVLPNDKYIKSPYNTYLYKGLPPAPIANPSVAAVLAALNPLKTDCLFYFHDKSGEIHCTPTYKEHVALLKKYYGQGI